MRIIDAHAHTIARQLTREYGNDPWRPTIEKVKGGQLVKNDWQTDGPSPREITDVSGILEDMDELRINTMVMCTSLYLCSYHLPPEIGFRAAQTQNDAIADLCRDHRHRFAGLGVVPLQDINMTIKEIRRVKEDLRLQGIGIGSNVRGAHLGAPQFELFWEAVAEMDLFVFIHPSLIREYLPPTLTKYHLGNTIGLPTETAINAADMIFSGLFERLPTLKVLLAHAGGVMPWLMGRWQHGYEVREEARKNLRQSPIESAKKFYVDTITHSKKALRYLIETFGADHVLLGSDFPWDMGPASPVKEVEELDISPDDTAMILGGNAVRLMGLDPIAR